MGPSAAHETESDETHGENGQGRGLGYLGAGFDLCVVREWRENVFAVSRAIGIEMEGIRACEGYLVGVDYSESG